MGRLASRRAEGPLGPEVKAPLGFRRFCGFWGYALLLQAVVVLLAPIAQGELWAPYELRFAELSRRLAFALTQAKDFTMQGDPSYGPTLRDLGQGELPFVATALGFAVLGLHDWAGRLVSMAFALVTVLSLLVVLVRLVNRSVAAVAVLVLCTTPLFVWQSRAMLGDAATMASLALASAGFLLSCLDPSAAYHQGRWAPRLVSAGWFGLGLLGAGLGVLCRGLWIGVAVPTLAAGLGCWFGRAARGESSRRAVPILLVSIGGLATVGGGLLLMQRVPSAAGFVSVWLGGVSAVPVRVVTFDGLLAPLVHATFPYAAVIPFAFGTLCLPPRADVDDAGARRRALGLALVLTCCLSYAAIDLSAIRVEPPPYPAVAALSGALALAFSCWVGAGRWSATLIIGILSVAILVAADFENNPSWMMDQAGQTGAFMPDAFIPRARTLVRFATVAAVAGGVLGLLPRFCRRTDDGRTFRQRSLCVLGWLSSTHSGLWLHVLVVVQTAWITLGLLAFLQRWGHLTSSVFPRDPTVLRLLSVGWVLIPLGVFALPALLATVSVLARHLAGRPRVLRLVKMSPPAGFLIGGLIMTVLLQPELSVALSPREAIERYRSTSREREPLALLGVNPRVLAYSLGVHPTEFSCPSTAVDWLLQDSARRWLLVDAAALADLNAAYREHTRSRKNIPLAGAADSRLLLATSQPLPGQPSRHPLKDVVTEGEPRPSHPTTATLGGVLRMLGWDLRDEDGHPANSIERGERYTLCFSYAVTGAVVGEWSTFVHLDGEGRRYTGDHETTNGRYPMRLWQRGDSIVDCGPVEMDTSFPAGRYTLFSGLFRGSRRMVVAASSSEDNRVACGTIAVR